MALCQSEDGNVASPNFDDYEPFTDQNGNNIWDAAEPFTDTGNGIYDIGEKFIDSNGNNKRDLILWYMDANKNRKWDSGDSFEDINQNGKKDFKEKYTDLNNNGKFDPSEKVNNFKFNYNAQVFAEDFIDASNGRYDQGERFEDLNEDEKWTDAESFEDLNGDGLWSLIEKEPVQVETVTIPEELIAKPIVETPEPEPEVEKIITSDYEKFEVLDGDVVLSPLRGDSEMEVGTIEIIPDSIIKVTELYEETAIYEDITDEWIPAKYYPLLPQLLNPFPRKTKTLSFKSNHPFWNGRTAGEVVKQVNATKKLNKIKQDDKAGLNLNTIVLYNRWEDKQHNDMVDLQIPAVISIDWYKTEALKENAEKQFREKFIKHITKKSKNTNARGKGISIINTQIGETDVELNINGNISVDGALVFENKDLVTTNLKESKSWDLEIEQTQRFNIDGNIGDRFFVKIKQDSEADFTWENDLTIEYKGDKNDILQKAEAGNINLSLEGMDAVTMGGSNSSLFGIKAVSQLGPVEIQSVIAREQVKKSEKNYEGGAESGGSTIINDYNYLKDRYFFIDETFKANFYPLNETNQHENESNYVVGGFELFQKVTSSESAALIQADAYLYPTDSSSYSVGGAWEKLDSLSTHFKSNDGCCCQQFDI